MISDVVLLTVLQEHVSKNSPLLMCDVDALLMCGLGGAGNGHFSIFLDRARMKMKTQKKVFVFREAFQGHFRRSIRSIHS